MDVQGVRARLAGWGVGATYDDDQVCRAALFLAQLEATETFFRTTLNGARPNGVGTAGYPFVATAVTDPSLLEGLADGLDEWVSPAVARAVAQVGQPNQPATMVDWFTANIFDANDQTFAQNVANFLQDYPITGSALAAITDNFQRNIHTACTRIIDDRGLITAMFADQYTGGYTLRSLTKITSTGSDFHKGGQQVLVLSFAIGSFGGWWPTNSVLNLIYKPGDVEIDCLITGDSATANRLITDGVQPFMGSSLVEILNTTAATMANPPAGWTPLPTYRILPRFPVSRSVPVNARYPIRAAYGYIECLSYAFTGDSFAVNGYYPWGASDFAIFKSQTPGPIIDGYYRQMGELLGLALTFSLQDLHVENVRARAYQPHLIDLEACLTRPIDSITSTSLLLGGNGGIDGYERNERRWTIVPRSDDDDDPPFPLFKLDDVAVPKRYQNRLKVLTPTARLVDVDGVRLIEGMRAGLAVIAAAQQKQPQSAFDPWFARLANVLVRVLPVGTGSWLQVRNQIYATSVLQGAPPVALAPAIQRTLDAFGLTAVDNYQNDLTVLPTFVGYFAPQVAVDLTAFDIPSFYHRIGSVDMLDSDGAVVAIPATVTTGNGQQPPVPVVTPTNAPRVTYFAQAPTGPVVQVGQVQALPGVLAAQQLQWENQIRFRLDMADLPDEALVH